MAEDSQDDSRSKVTKGCLWLIGIVVGLTILGAIVGEPPDQSDEQTATIVDGTNQATEASENTSEVETSGTVQETATSRLTGPQRNAVRSARQYLEIQGFSRNGLIEQLSSDYGDGYDRSDAAAAVNSLDVDWNQQAARSARQYLEMMGFSCRGLIEQLSSSAGDKYTQSEARFGAEQAGAC